MTSARFRAAQLLFALAVIGGFLAISAEAIDPDLGWHLRVGGEVAASGEIPRADSFSWTMPGHEWVDHEWSQNAALWWLHAHSMWWAAILAFALLASLPFLIWFARARSLGELLFVFVGAMTMHHIAGVRPQILSFALFFATYELLRRRNYGALPFVFFAWANLHAGFASGLALFGVYVAAEAFAAWFRARRVLIKEYLFPAGMFVASVGATFLNPYGIGLYGEILTVLGSSETTTYIQEWLPIASHLDYSILLYLAAVLVFLYHFRRRYDTPTFAVVGFFLFFAVRSVRNWPLLLIVTLPAAVQAARWLREEVVRLQADHPFTPKAARYLRVFAVVSFVAVFVFFGYRLATYRPALIPAGAAAFLNSELTAQERSSARMFNEYGWGGYLIWNVPDVKVFIDGRMPHWKDKETGNSAMEDYVQAYIGTEGEGWEEVFARRGIDLAVVSNIDPRSQTSFLVRHMSDETKEKLRQSTALKTVNSLLSSGDIPIFLKEELVKAGWQVLYEDSLAAVLKKP